MPQKRFWEREYQGRRLGLVDSSSPSHSVHFLLNYLRKKKIKSGFVLEVGCGNGRNIIFLSKHGFKTVGIDFCKEPLRDARKIAKQNRILKKIRLLESDISKSLPFRNNSFDIVLDIFGSGTLNKEERRFFQTEVERVLRPGGFFLIYAPNRKYVRRSEDAQPFEKGERGEFIYPSLRLIERAYDLHEFAKLFQSLRIVAKKEIQFYGLLFGQKRRLSYVCAILQKPLN